MLFWILKIVEHVFVWAMTMRNIGNYLNGREMFVYLPPPKIVFNVVHSWLCSTPLSSIVFFYSSVNTLLRELQNLPSLQSLNNMIKKTTWTTRLLWTGTDRKRQNQFQTTTHTIIANRFSRESFLAALINLLWLRISCAMLACVIFARMW